MRKQIRRLAFIFIAGLVSVQPLAFVPTRTSADNLDNNSPTHGSPRAAIRNANLSPGADTSHTWPVR